MVTFHQLSDDERSGMQALLSGFLHGECYAFAIAMQRGTGWPIFGLIKDNLIYHAAVKMPSGNFFDARGEFKAEDFGKPFGACSNLELRETSESELRSIREVNSVDWATIFIEKCWPNLPGWKKSDFQQRARLFMEELEELGKKHQIVIRSPIPTFRPILSPLMGDEKGYEVWPAINSQEYFFDRHLL